MYRNKKKSRESLVGQPAFPIYQCPPGAQVAWIARQPEEIRRLRRGGAVQTASVPFMSRSDEILSSDARYPSFKCIEAYSSEYISSTNFDQNYNEHDTKAINI